ncbi:hypothetical protein [Myxococcus sp. Y35]|uniref:hypothetical protein n=1 Tax=Pseudomyxococcus flavus TaxID=3115648 RepID=UPI003CF1F19F
MRPRRLLSLTLGLLLVTGCSSSSSDDDGPGPSDDAGTNRPDGGGAGPSDCLSESFLSSLGKDRLLVGAQMADGTAASAPFDIHYLYIAGGLFDSPNACTSCTSGCSASGTSCQGGGCAWWGCWQDVSQPPGDYVRGFVSRTRSRGQFPLITYYQQLLGSGRAEGEQQLEALNELSFMRRYLADWRFVVQQVGDAQAMLHIEPDLWGYLQFFHGTASSVPAQVASANPTDCGGMENNAAGLGRCMIAMARKYAPNAKVGLHASPWATRIDVYLNTDASFDVAGEARKVADFLSQVGASETDFVVVEASDRDAGFYQSQGEDVWWDATNATRPNFHQAFAWAKAVSEQLNLPNLWWQLPVGHMALPNTDMRWRDNRVDYFFSHLDEVAAAHSLGFSFGAGEGRQTTPETDNGNLVSRVRAYASSGGQAPCVPTLAP